jgi:tetratricopeptide (TPR) repeat protein
VDGASQPTYSETNFNYAQPIDTEAPAPDQTVSDTALTTFDQARQSFIAGQYPEALTGVEQALAKLPNDAVLHEFRALTLFALGRYADAAATLYPVLSIQPGMDWTSLSGLYSDVNVFTGQLRALEAQRDAKPDDPAIRFLLGYLYSCMGFKDQAATQYEKIVAIQPKDTLSAGLLKAIRTPSETAAPDPSKPEVADTASQQQPVAAKNPAPAEMLAGAFTATPGDGRTIALSFEPDSKFTWSFTPSGGNPSVFKGTYTYAEGVLTLVSNQNGQVMVGRVEKVSDTEFQFVWVGAGQGEPGLDFRKG